MTLLANALRLAGMLVAFGIAVGIALVALEAKESGQLVGPWLDACRFLTEPFDRLVDLEKGREKLQIGINWGIAALLYLLLGVLLAKLLTRAAGGVRTRRARGRRAAAD